MIEPRDILKLEEVCKYDDNNRKWIVPLFTVGQRRVEFPKNLNGVLGNSQAGFLSFNNKLIAAKSKRVPEFKVANQLQQMQNEAAANNEIKFLSDEEARTRKQLNHYNSNMNLTLGAENF